MVSDSAMLRKKSETPAPLFEVALAFVIFIRQYPPRGPIMQALQGKTVSIVVPNDILRFITERAKASGMSISEFLLACVRKAGGAEVSSGTPEAMKTAHLLRPFLLNDALTAADYATECSVSLITARKFLAYLENSGMVAQIYVQPTGRPGMMPKHWAVSEKGESEFYRLTLGPYFAEARRNFKNPNIREDALQYVKASKKAPNDSGGIEVVTAIACEPQNMKDEPSCGGRQGWVDDIVLMAAAFDFPPAGTRELKEILIRITGQILQDAWGYASYKPSMVPEWLRPYIRVNTQHVDNAPQAIAEDPDF